jgi:hypothetical protein
MVMSFKQVRYMAKTLFLRPRDGYKKSIFFRHIATMSRILRI